MTEREQLAVYVPLLKAIKAAAAIEKRLTIAAQVGWPVDVSADMAIARGHVRHAQLEFNVAKTRQRFQERQQRERLLR